MTTEEFLREFEQIANIKPGTLAGRQVLADLPQWDSLTALQFVLWVQNRFGIVVDGEKVSQAVTIDDLIALSGGAIQD